MRIWPWVGALAGASAATLLYGAVVEANRLAVERRRIRVPGWPNRLDGYRIALLGDLHVRDDSSTDLARRACQAAADSAPDAVCLVGDFVEDWRPGAEEMLREAIAPLAAVKASKIAVPGNHDHRGGAISLLEPILEEVGVRLLRNEFEAETDLVWIGVDSANAMECNPYLPMMRLEELSESDPGLRELPSIVLWHEPDAVDWLPKGATLMLSGHSHGGQFTFPWGWTPMHTRNGRKYVRGYYPEAPTPLFVTRGIGVTGPPSRLCCTPEVAILELHSE